MLLPFISLSITDSIFPSPSIGLPVPSNTLPSISTESFMLKGFPFKIVLVSVKFIPFVPSYTCIAVIFSSIEITFPILVSPFFNINCTCSSNEIFFGVFI